MRSLLLLLAGLLACGGDSPVEKADPDGDSGGDTGVAPAGARCPADMVGVPAVNPVYCVDPYEVAVVDGIAVSAAGVVPTEGLTFDEAQAACAAAMVVDEAGVARGPKHLITSAEWEDAADNVVGAGGTRYPYGDDWVDGACVTATAAGAPGTSGTQPAGGAPACVSSFGVYDQVGNLWEWMDPGYAVDSAKALARFAALGVTVQSPDGRTLLGEGPVEQLQLQVIGVLPGTVSAVEGRLFVSADQLAFPDRSRGFMRALTDDPAAGWYPVELEPVDGGAGGAWINADPSHEGTAIPDKRGCAWYVGYGEGCDVHLAVLFHTHDFRGTIGFRCAAPSYR